MMTVQESDRHAGKVAVLDETTKFGNSDALITIEKGTKVRICHSTDCTTFEVLEGPQAGRTFYSKKITLANSQK